jgi:hypothetical protein
MKKKLSNFNPYLYQIIEFKACKQAHELHYAKKMQTLNTLKQQLLTNTSTYKGIEPLTLAILT